MSAIAFVGLCCGKSRRLFTAPRQTHVKKMPPTTASDKVAADVKQMKNQAIP